MPCPLCSRRSLQTLRASFATAGPSTGAMLVLAAAAAVRVAIGATLEKTVRLGGHRALAPPQPPLQEVEVAGPVQAVVPLRPAWA